MPRKTRGRKNRRNRKTRRRMRGGSILSNVRIKLTTEGKNLLNSRDNLKTLKPTVYVELVKGREQDDDDNEYTVYDQTKRVIYGYIDNSCILGDTTLGDKARMALRSTVAYVTCQEAKKLPRFFNIMTLAESSEGGDVYLASGTGKDKQD